MPRGFRLPSPAMAVALLALVASTTGAGIAAVKIDGADLKDRSVSTPKLKIGVIRAPQLATGAVTTTKIKSRAVTTDALAAGTIRADDLGAGSVGSTQIADGAVLGAEIGTGAVTDGKIANGAVSRAKLTADAALPLVVVRRSVETQVPGGTIIAITATCAAGERVMGGGAAGTAEPPLPSLLVIGGVPSPNADGDTPTAWVATVRNAEMAAAAARAYAICARGLSPARPPLAGAGGRAVRGVSANLVTRRGPRERPLHGSPSADHNDPGRLRLRRG